MVSEMNNLLKNYKKKIKELESSIKALRISEEKYRQIWEFAPDAIFLTKMGGKNSGKILDANPAASMHTGYSHEELIGMNIVTALPADKEAKDLVNVRENDLKQGNKVLFSEKKKRKDGSEYWTEIHIRNMLVGGEQAALSINRDITQWKTAEEALQKSESQKQAILDGIKANIAFVNNNLEILWVNMAGAKSVGKSPEDIIGYKCYELWGNPKKLCEDCPTVKAFQTGQSECAILTTSDGRVWDEYIQPVFDQGGELIGVIKIANEITDRKKKEEALKESEAKFKNIFENKGIAMGVFGEDSIITDCNTMLLDMLGFSKSDIVGKMKWSDFVDKKDLERLMEHHSQLLKNSDSLPLQYECSIINKNGEIINVIVNIGLIGENWVASLADITDHKLAEEEILKLKDGLEVLVVEKTKELTERNMNLECFFDATLNRELRMKELRDENKKLKAEAKKNKI